MVDDGGLLYDSDYYGDDLPFWTEVTRSDGVTAPTWWCPPWTSTTCALPCRGALATANRFINT